MKKIYLMAAFSFFCIMLNANAKAKIVTVKKEVKNANTKVETVKETVNTGKQTAKEIENKAKKSSLVSKIFPKKETKEWKLVWSDEFNGTELDKTKWKYWENGNPWKDGNYIDEKGELVDQYGFKVKHYYLRDNVKLENGNLVIKIKKENNKTVKVDGKDRKILYSSGAVHTKGLYSVQEGKIEMRAAMPKGIGTWPAFWMWPHDYSQSVGKPANGEIDIVETYGDNLRRVTGTLHAIKSDNTYESFTGNALKLSSSAKDLTEFHTYAIEWDKDEIKWLFDGKVYKKISMKSIEKKVTNPFNQPYYLMINVALENKTGVESEVHFPTEMKVDYVRVYK